jgi:hypothetical protein
LIGLLLQEAYREPANNLERGVWRSISDDGYLVLKRGWPDLAVIDLNRQKLVAAVEVKSETDQVRPAQHAILNAMVASGIPSYVYKDGKGFVPVANSPTWRSL